MFATVRGPIIERLQLHTLPTAIPEIHLYSDGGLDISKDGNYLITGALAYIPSSPRSHYSSIAEDSPFPQVADTNGLDGDAFTSPPCFATSASAPPPALHRERARGARVASSAQNMLTDDSDDDCVTASSAQQPSLSLLSLLASSNQPPPAEPFATPIAPTTAPATPGDQAAPTSSARLSSPFASPDFFQSALLNYITPQLNRDRLGSSSSPIRTPTIPLVSSSSIPSNQRTGYPSPSADSSSARPLILDSRSDTDIPTGYYFSLAAHSVDVYIHITLYAYIMHISNFLRTVCRLRRPRDAVPLPDMLRRGPAERVPRARAAPQYIRFVYHVLVYYSTLMCL